MNNKTRDDDRNVIPLVLLILTTVLVLLLLNVWFTSDSDPVIDKECVYWEFKYTMRNRIESELMCNNDSVVRDGEIKPLPTFYDSAKRTINAHYEELLKNLPKQEKPE